MVQTRSSRLSLQESSRVSSSRRARVSTIASSIASTSSPLRKSRRVSIHKGSPRGKIATHSAERGIKALHGREREFSTICSWIDKAITTGEPLSAYISGSPGTGKTATMELVCQYFGDRIYSTVLNCASVNSHMEIVKSILDVLKSSARPSMQTLSTTLKKLKKHFVLILDEIDHLATKTNSFLCTTFQWPQTMAAKLIVIGIANSIDLTERLLPKLKMKQPPETLVFAPYSKDEIAEILRSKLSTESNYAMEPSALELCSRKIAAVSGDLRTAFHVIKQSRFDEPGTPLSCRQVLGVLNNVYSSPLVRARLPLQPRLLLAVAVAMSSKKSVVNVASLTAAYSRACDVVNVPRLDGDDLTSALQVLESQSFIKEGPAGQIVLQVDAATAKTAIADNVMIAQVSELNL
ncbi:hypothetical protein KIN20_037092 [Parelaphostrongylus tenuis]|uniref:AAA+ ATPase domain-containing protein n=1 Tax=Parelaphostrongylus tenuis TaxID=148309 RepID=A0AAD5WM63_PARTN|nr:hypothetical protein KIN20_037092 [Parelaphostrongylus tenuis]